MYTLIYIYIYIYVNVIIYTLQKIKNYILDILKQKTFIIFFSLLIYKIYSV